MQERYDIIGDVHGCLDTLRRLCDTLGYDAEFDTPTSGGLSLSGIWRIAARTVSVFCA